MPVHDWISAEKNDEGRLVGTSREFLRHFTPSVFFSEVPPQIFFWVAVLLVVFIIVKDLFTRYLPKFRSLDYKRRISTVCYAVQILVTTPALVIMAYYGGDCLFYAVPQHFVKDGGNRIQDWNEDLAWTRALDSIYTGLGYGIIPVMSWYLVELCLLASVGCASIWVVTHHVLSIVLVLYNIAPAVQCVDLLFFRLGWVLMMHALLEQPQFTALLLHRLDAVARLDLVFLGSCIYSVLHRGALLAATFWIYAEICWLRPVYNSWTLFHRWFQPPVVSMLFIMQSYPVYVYFVLYKQHVNRRKGMVIEDEGSARQDLGTLPPVQELTSIKVVDMPSAVSRSGTGVSETAAADMERTVTNTSNTSANLNTNGTIAGEDSDPQPQLLLQTQKSLDTAGVSKTGLGHLIVSDDSDHKELSTVSSVYDRLPASPRANGSPHRNNVGPTSPRSTLDMMLNGSESPRSTSFSRSTSALLSPMSAEFMPQGVVGALPGMTPRPHLNKRTVTRNRSRPPSSAFLDGPAGAAAVDRTISAQSTTSSSVTFALTASAVDKQVAERWESVQTRDRAKSRLDEPKKYVEGWACIMSCAILGISAFMLAFLVLYRPCNCQVLQIRPNQRVGVVGGGIAGLAAAWRLAEAGYKVTVFEQSDHWGGAANTFRMNVSSSESVGYDMGVKFWPPAEYPNFEHLLGFLNVTNAVMLGSALQSFPHVNQPEPTFASPTLVNLSRVVAVNLHEDVKSPWSVESQRFTDLLSYAAETYNEAMLMGETITEFLDKNHFSTDFRSHHVLPCISVFIGTGATALNASLAVLIASDRSFRMCTSRGRTTVKTFPDGMEHYVSKFVLALQRLGVDLRLNAQVDEVVPRSSSSFAAVDVKLMDGQSEAFSQVIMTARLQDIGHMERSTSDSLKRHLFGQMGSSSPGYAPYVRTVSIAQNYTASLEPSQWNGSCWRGDLVHVHTFANSSFMCGTMYRPADISADLGSDCRPFNTGNAPIGVFYAEEDAAHAFIPPANRLATRVYRMPSHTPNYMRVGRNLHKVQGRDRIWYAGADAVSLNFHEGALISGLVIARELGATYPWPDYPHASARFLALQQWMMWGNNYFISPLSKK